jgi:hypothetical protein
MAVLVCTYPIILSYLKGGKNHLSHISLLFGPDHYNQKDNLEGEYFAGNEAEYGSRCDFLFGVDQDPAQGQIFFFTTYKHDKKNHYNPRGQNLALGHLIFSYKIAEITKEQRFYSKNISLIMYCLFLEKVRSGSASVSLDAYPAKCCGPIRSLIHKIGSIFSYVLDP